MNRIVPILLLAAGCGACALPYRLVSAHDDFRGEVRRAMSGNTLADPDGDGAWVALDAEVLGSRGDSARYFLVVRYGDARRWLRIPAGTSLYLLVDGEPAALRGPGSRGRRARRLLRGVEEEARFEVGEALIRRLASCREGRVRVMGRREYIERSLTARNRERFRAFLEANEG